MTTNAHPRAVAGLDVNEADDGLVVYAEATETVHHLNATAAVIFSLCDGTRDADAIAAEVAVLFALGAPPIEETRACLDDLAANALVH
jgi:Coenzyme PQQ synthesis protein D (PqqD)